MIYKLARFFTAIKQSWLESVMFLAPARLSAAAFLLRTTLIYILKTWYAAVWVLGIAFICLFLGTVFSYKLSGIFGMLIDFGSWVVLTVITISTARASVAYKNSQYLLLYSIRGLLLLPLLALLFMGITTTTISWLLLVLLRSFLVSFTVFSVLFWFDARVTLRDYLVSILRTSILVIYNYPFCLITYLFLQVLYSSISWLPEFSWVIASIRMIGLVGSSIVYLCILTNFYIKRVHDQFMLYY